MFRGYIIYGEILLDNDLYLNAFSWFRFSLKRLEYAHQFLGKNNSPKNGIFLGHFQVGNVWPKKNYMKLSILISLIINNKIYKVVTKSWLRQYFSRNLISLIGSCFINLLESTKASSPSEN